MHHRTICPIVGGVPGTDPTAYVLAFRPQCICGWKTETIWNERDARLACMDHLTSTRKDKDLEARVKKLEEMVKMLVERAKEE
jgi:hypothetical protein